MLTENQSGASMNQLNSDVSVILWYMIQGSVIFSHFLNSPILLNEG